MVEQIIDLHVHSKYSRACSKLLELPHIAAMCEKKGINIVSTGDFTHPLWVKHLEEQLVEENEGVYKLRSGAHTTRFILGTEVSCIYSHKGKTRRVHLLLFAPSLEVVKKFNHALEERGVNIRSDGRPIMGLSAKEILALCLSIDERMVLIPAHAWTPWFAVFGSKSGYDSLEECFEELTPHIRAIETGLSSDPTMNHRLSQLDGITLISNSDAHGLDNLGREANVFAFNNEKEITYQEIFRIIQTGDRKKFLYTIEFYPEEGKYHFDGHAACQVSFSSEETKKHAGLCPVCKKELTLGVLYRIHALADRAHSAIPVEKFIPHRYIVPLREIIAQVIGVGVGSKKVASEYARLISEVGNEFFILLHAPTDVIALHTAFPLVGEAIAHMRDGKVQATPGYDGVFGTIDLLVPKNISSQRQVKLV